MSLHGENVSLNPPPLCCCCCLFTSALHSGGEERFLLTSDSTVVLLLLLETWSLHSLPPKVCLGETKTRFYSLYVPVFARFIKSAWLWHIFLFEVESSVPSGGAHPPRIDLIPFDGGWFKSQNNKKSQNFGGRKSKFWELKSNYETNVNIWAKKWKLWDEKSTVWDISVNILRSF